MFNSYAKGGDASASANNYLKINAISGTLIKNHPKSIFVRAKKDSTIFDPTNPRCLFPKSKDGVRVEYRQKHFTPGLGWDLERCEVKVKEDVEVPCVVLQAMIIGEDSFLCEIVTVDDFYGGVDDGSYKE